ncbi:MAG: hypothetical protein HY765_06950 [Rhodomicrobium sp.]|nr:hypothetical protein [Rhodomicrobium sp.]
MKTASSSPLTEDEKQRRKEEAERPKFDYDELDRALADTFPASDPPAMVVKGRACSPRHPGNDRGAK